MFTFWNGLIEKIFLVYLSIIFMIYHITEFSTLKAFVIFWRFIILYYYIKIVFYTKSILYIFIILRFKKFQLYGYIHMNLNAGGIQKGVKSHIVGVTGGCELSSVHIENQFWILSNKTK